MFKLHTSQDDTVETSIAMNCTLVGTLKTSGNVVMAGRIDGNIEVEHLQIQASGSVHANVHATTCIVHGEVKGSISARNSILVSPSAKVLGDIEATTIRIEQGAFFKGTSNTFTDTYE